MVDQMTADALADALDAGKSFALIDTRSPDSFEGWHVQGAENVPYDPREGLDDDQIDAVRAVADDGPVVTMCGKGLTSAAFAFDLEQAGYEDVTVVKGGMEDWSKVYEVVPVDTGDEDLVLLQLQRRGKGCLGYVVGSREAGRAAVIDATRQIETFEIAVEEAGLTIDRVFDTHVHADHLSGGPRLADRLDVPYHMGETADERGVRHDFEPLANGETVEVGGVEIEMIDAPGHTTEMVNYLIDGAHLLSGDTLFVDSVGRTELQFGDANAETGARQLYETIQETILELPEDTRVLPGHVSVTPDGRFENGKPGEPIEAQLGNLRENLDLLGLNEESFVRRLVDDAPEKPPNYERVIAINTGRESVEEGEAIELELGPNNCAA